MSQQQAMVSANKHVSTAQSMSPAQNQARLCQGPIADRLPGGTAPESTHACDHTTVGNRRGSQVCCANGARHTALDVPARAASSWQRLIGSRASARFLLLTLSYPQVLAYHASSQVAWCSWSSRLPHTQEVRSSSLCATSPFASPGCFLLALCRSAHPDLSYSHELVLYMHVWRRHLSFLFAFPFLSLAQIRTCTITVS